MLYIVLLEAISTVVLIILLNMSKF